MITKEIIIIPFLEYQQACKPDKLLEKYARIYSYPTSRYLHRHSEVLQHMQVILMPKTVR